MAKEITKNLERAARPVKPIPLDSKGSYTCSECGKSFDYDLPVDEHSKLVTRKGGNTPLKVKCPHCTARVCIHGTAPATAGTTITRKDWPADVEKPWVTRGAK